MLSTTEDLKTKLLTEIARCLVDNIQIRTAVKNQTEKTSMDPEILLEIKTLAQRLDMSNGLDKTAGNTILEKAVNYLKSSVILKFTDDTKLSTFVKALSALPAQSPAPLTPSTTPAAKPGEKEQHGELVPFNVSGYGNNCGLFAMVLGIKIALESQANVASANHALAFLMSIDDASLQHATDNSDEIGRMLRLSLAQALRSDAAIKARRFETFVSYCTAYLIHADLEKLDRELEALYKANVLEMTAMYNIWTIIFVNKGLEQEHLVTCVQKVQSHDISEFIPSCYRQISELLLKIDTQNSSEIVKTIVQSIAIAKDDPVEHLIKLRKLLRAAWARVTTSQASEQQREIFYEAIRKYFIQQYMAQFVGNIEEEVNLNSLFLFATIESMLFDGNGNAKDLPNRDAIIQECRSLFAELQAAQFWETKLYPNYCNYIEKTNVKIAADELACLATYWNVQLSIKMRTGEYHKTYTQRNTQLLHISLTNPSEDHWLVLVDKDSLQQHRLLSTSEIKSSRLQPPQLPTAAAPSKPILSTATSSGVRGVFDNTLTQPISNEEFDLQIYRLANYLLKQYPNAKRVALFMQQSVDYMRCFFALHHAGKAAMPISPNTDIPAVTLASFLKGGDVDLIISHSRYRQHPFFYTAEVEGRKKQIIYIDELRVEIDNSSQDKPNIVNRDESLAYIVNTSGSTGVPKQVLVPHRGLKDCTNGHIQVLKITAEDNIAAYADPAFDAHIIEMFIQRTIRSNLFIVPADARRDLLKLSKFYQTHKITIGVFVASMLRQCKRKDFPHLRVVICTGEKLDKTIIDEWSDIMLIDGYGPAEYTIATWLKVIHAADKSEMFLIPNTECFIMQKEPDAPGAEIKPVKQGEEGELYLTGNGLAIGYTNDDLTKARFVEMQHPNGSGLVRVYKTRDVAKQNPDGTLDIVGRLDRQIKVYGRVFYPEAVEEIIKKEMSIEYVYVDASLNAKGHPEIIAYLEYKGTNAYDIAALYLKICTQIAQTFAPTCWVISTELPKTASGKVDSKKLPTLQEPRLRVHGSSHVLARSDLEKELTNLFYEVLSISTDVPIYRDDNFFYLGGKSLQATVFLQVLRDRFQLRLSYDDFTLLPTVELLAHAVLRVRANTQLKEIVSLYDEKQEANNAPVILIHSLLGDALRDYEKLKAVWNYPHSLYVINARGLKDPNDMDNDLYTIAYDYYRAIKEKFPRGLKVIAGWSMGGVLATLIKHFFQLDGDDSAAVLMIDSESPTTFQSMPPLDYAKFLHDLFTRKLSGQFNLKELPKSIEELATLTKEKQVNVLFDAVEAQLAPGAGLEYKKGLLATVRGLLLGVLKLQLDRRLENIKMITASETQSNHANSGNLGWPEDKVKTDLLVTIAGNHDSIMLETNNVRIVAEHLSHFARKQQNEFLVHKLASNKDWREFPDIDDENLRYYIPAMGARNPNTPPVELLKLVREEFLNTPKKVLLMLGEAGVGKTTFLCWLAKQLQENRKPDSPIVLYIPLGNYENPQHGLIEAHLRRLGFNESQIEHLKKHQKFIFILDGYDEIDKDRYQNLYATNRLDEWNAQVITGCRLSYLINAQNYRTSFYPIAKERVLTEALSEVTILPFNDSQIEEFIKAYLRNPPEDVSIDEEWRDYKKYISHIDSLPGLRQLIRNPFLLRVLMEVLPDIVVEYEHLPPEKRLPITTSKILDAFVARFWERAVFKLMRQGKLPEDGRDIRIDYDQFSINFAKDLKLAGLTNVIYRPALKDQPPSQWEKYFGSDPSKIKIREGCLLKRQAPAEENKTSSYRRPTVNRTEPMLKGEIVGFIHPMLIEYFIGRGIYLDFLLMEQTKEDEELLRKVTANNKQEDIAERFTSKNVSAFFQDPQAFAKPSAAAAAASDLRPPAVSAKPAAAIVSAPSDEDDADLQLAMALSMETGSANTRPSK